MTNSTSRLLTWRPAVMFLALSLIVVGFISMPQPAHAATTYQGYTLTEVRKIILTKTNAARTKLGLKPLVANVALDKVAQDWSAVQASQSKMYHNPKFSQQYPAGWAWAAENVAYGYDVNRVVDAWIQSPGHYKNIVRATTNTIGIGVGISPKGSLYYTQNFAEYKTQPVPAPPASKASIKTIGDIVTIDGAGKLWNYGKSGVVGVKSRTLIGSGWSSFKSIKTVDYNSDGVTDIIGQAKDGKLYAYLGRAAGGFTKITIGGGWASMEIDVNKWKTTDKFPSIITKDTAGNLWIYPNTKGSTLGARIKIGSGWTSLELTVVDYNNDGKVEVVAKTQAGDLLLYRTNGNGTFLNEARQKLSSGFAPYELHTIKGFTTPTSQGILARYSDGRLFYYPFNENGKFTTSITVGSGGWNTMNIANK